VCVCVGGGGGVSNPDKVPLFVHRNLWPYTEGGRGAVSGDAIWGCDSLCGSTHSVFTEQVWFYILYDPYV
jgi:hypothetical protein